MFEKMIDMNLEGILVPAESRSTIECQERNMERKR